MPINVYTGLMRSGKSFEVVSEVILNAIAQGRRVVTNVDGISNDLIRQYVADKRNLAMETLGTIVHVTNEDVFKDDFFPYYDNAKSSHTDTIVQPGDLVCIDEAWRFWPASGAKIHKNHQSFFLEHGHFTHPDTGVACDLVLMVQDMSTINRFIKNVVAFNFRTHKKISLGMGNTYSVNMWEGSKQNKATLIGNWVRKYNKEIFPLYSSFKGGADGKTVNVDARQNIFSNPKLWFMVGIAIIGGSMSFYGVWRFFNPSTTNTSSASANKPSATPSNSGAAGIGMPQPDKPATPPFSDIWRITGSFSAKGQYFVVLTNPAGQVRVESPSMFQGSGYSQIGEIDGARTTAWSATTPIARSGFSPQVNSK